MHSFVLILGWPIHSSAFLLCSLNSLQYCKDNIDIVSLCSGLHSLHHTLDRYAPVLHFSWSSSFNVCKSYSPSLPSQLSIIGIFSLSCMLYLLAMKVFFISISKFHSSSCYCVDFQSIVGCFSTELPVLGITFMIWQHLLDYLPLWLSLLLLWLHLWQPLLLHHVLFSFLFFSVFLIS